MRSSSALMPKRERYFWKAHLFFILGIFFCFALFLFFLQHHRVLESESHMSVRAGLTQQVKATSHSKRLHVFVKMSGGFDSHPFTFLPLAFRLPLTHVRW